MKNIKIYIQDSDKVSENEDLGFKKNDEPYSLTDLYFDETQLSGFWIDKEVDDRMGTLNIVFYLNGVSFCTPFNDNSLRELKECLNMGL